MHSLSSFIVNNWDQFGIPLVARPEQLRFLLIAPPFRSCVVLLIFCCARPAPIIVAKVPRLPGRKPARFISEESNLRLLSSVRGISEGSIPRLLALADTPELCALIQTALPGKAPDHEFICKHASDYINSALAWLIGIHSRTARSSSACPQWRVGNIDTPLHYLQTMLPRNNEDQRLLDRTVGFARDLDGLSLPLVFEHGDFTRPNILLSPAGDIGVVDWEAATPTGLPAVDVFSLLASVAFSYSCARRRDLRVCFREAFFGSSAWALAYLRTYAAALGLPARSIRSLFVLCWTRYLGNLANLLHVEDPDGHPTLEGDRLTRYNVHHYRTYWREAVEHIDALRF